MQFPIEFHAQQIAEIILRSCTITQVVAHDKGCKIRGIKFPVLNTL